MSKFEVSSAADAWIGSGFWKFAYVTNDREAAIGHCKKHLGIENFWLFEPTFNIVMRDGRRGTVRTKAAFSVGRDILVELVEPVDGLSELWSDPLRGAKEFAMVLHHTGVFVDDVDDAKRAAEKVGLTPVLENVPTAEKKRRWAYYAPPHLGFYVEVMESDGKWLDELRKKPRPGAK